MYYSLYARFEPVTKVVATTRLLGMVSCDGLNQIRHEAADGFTYYYWAYSHEFV